MTLLSTNPFESLLRLQQGLERALSAPTSGFEGPGSVFPPLNIFHDADGIVIRAEVPGFKSDQIEVSAEHDNLVVKGAVKGFIPLARQGDAAEIASMVAYLASSEAAYITGQVIQVDGGITL